MTGQVSLLKIQSLMAFGRIQSQNFTGSCACTLKHLESVIKMNSNYDLLR